MRKIIFLILFCLYSFNVSSEGYDVFGIGILMLSLMVPKIINLQISDLKEDLTYYFDIGPESDNFSFETIYWIGIYKISFIFYHRYLSRG